MLPEREAQIEIFLAHNNLATMPIEPIAGDASGRRYFRLLTDDQNYIVMDAPQNIDIERETKRIERCRKLGLAENNDAFVLIAGLLRDWQLSAPEIYDYDRNAGLILMEDLGHDAIQQNGMPVIERYLTAIDLLAKIHQLEHPASYSLGELSISFPRHSHDIQLTELATFIEWYLPFKLQRQASQQETEDYFAIWKALLQPLGNAPHKLALRDYHSPNLLWLEQRSDIQKIGLLDFQDAILATEAHDVTSLIEDARITVPKTMRMELYKYYIKQRRQASSAFDAEAFELSYSLIAVQRLMRILGVFARLSQQDGRIHYLAYVPHVLEYLYELMKNPVFASLHHWLRRTGVMVNGL